MIIETLGCTGISSKKYNDENDTLDTIAYVQKQPKRVKAKSPYEVAAIGDICMGISSKEFEHKRNEFLLKFPKLNGQKIKEIRGYFYKGKLERLLVISKRKQCVYYSPYGEGKRYPSDWQRLYEEKYGSYNFTKDGLHKAVYSRETLPKSNSIIFEIIDSENFYAKCDDECRSPLENVNHSIIYTPSDITDGTAPHKEFWGYEMIDIYNDSLFNKLVNDRKTEKDRKALEKEKQEKDVI